MSPAPSPHAPFTPSTNTSTNLSTPSQVGYGGGASPSTRKSDAAAMAPADLAHLLTLLDQKDLFGCTPAQR